MKPGYRKFRNKPTEVDGIRFASKKEANRYCELKLLEKAGKIWSLELQPRFQLIHAGELICTYVADFRYNPGGVVEDVKGVRTAAYQIKKKLMRILKGIEIQEV